LGRGFEASAVLVCVICIWVVKLVTVDIGSTKASVFKQTVKISPSSATIHLLIDPNYADAHECLGNAYLTLDHHEEAAEAYKESIGIDLSRRSYPAAFTLIGTRYL
jgi:tetratricopeptide (TPR) repeat protein